MINQQKLLFGKRIVVVGGAGLLGAHVCEAIITAGAHCIIADVSLDRAESVALQIEKSGLNRPAVVEVSIINEESVDKMIEQSSDIMGKIDGLLNTAYPRNKNYGRKFEDVKYQDFCENIDLHLGGYFLVSQKILEYFKRNGGGSLLNMSSIYGISAPRFDVYDNTQMTMPVEYAAIKAGIVNLTKYMAKYYKGNEIKVNCLSLGGLKDKQPESFLNKYRDYCLDKGMLDSSDISGTIVFLFSNMSKYINGQNIIVDDGFVL